MRTLLLIMLSALCAPAIAASPSATPAATTPSTSSPEQIKLQLREYFFDAAREGRQEMLAEFIRSHYDLNARDEKGYTALILAAYHGQRPAVEQLLSAGADPCAQDKRGNTALMGAIFKGELGIAKRLMQADCAPDQRNNAGQTAAMYAALFQRTDVLKDLATKGADLSLKDGQGNDVTKLQRGEFATAPAR
ncbi:MULTISPECIES: ankyrin repeat domain-containing protein [Xanthomonas]|uniref:ankyrin repeat domain-containing protein n=1 Tax=Xanthomonas TaxID=338 RepID=UPI000E1F674D|nr:MULTISPECIES: ankyrin repeat domain-containing protein [Xanthomonas]